MNEQLDRMTTYRRQDGDPIGNDWAWVTDIEWLDGTDHWERTVYLKETWVLESVEELVYGEPEPDQEDDG